MNALHTLIFGKKYGYDFLTGLVAYYPFDGNSNESINGYNGVDTSVTYTTAKNGLGASFNGTSSKIIVPNNLDFTPTNGTNDVPMSWSFWVNFSSINHMQLMTRRTTNSVPEWQISINNTGVLRFLIFSQNSTTNYLEINTSSGFFNVSQWTYITMTYDGSGLNGGLKLYKNGIAASTGSASTGTYVKCTNTGSNTAFGVGEWFIGNYINGILDEVAIWKNRELTSLEVAELYNSGAGKFYPF